MASKAVRGITWTLIVLVGIGLGVLLGLLVLPPGGPDPFLEPTPTVTASP